MLSMPETVHLRPSAQVPPPLVAHQRRPSAGAETTETQSPSSAWWRPIRVAQIGIPRVNPEVPSIGSTIHYHGDNSLPVTPCSSPNRLWLGRAASRRSESCRSACRSASVTSERSDLYSTRNERFSNAGNVTASQRSASSRASDRSSLNAEEDVDTLSPKFGGAPIT